MQVQTKVKGHISSYKSITYSSPFTITHKFQEKIAYLENTFHFDDFGTRTRANRTERIWDKPFFEWISFFNLFKFSFSISISDKTNVKKRIYFRVV